MLAVGKSASVTGLIVFGTTTSLLAKIVYELQSKGISGRRKYFEKPWAMTTVMFLGMTLMLPIAQYQAFRKKRKPRTEAEEALLFEDPTKTQSKKEILLLGIPSFFDLVATVLMNVGLLSVTASVYQMMRGAEMIFAAAFAVIFLKRSLNKFHYLGILCCLVGITLVGASSLLSGEGSSTHAVSPGAMLLGMSLIILSQAVQAAQLTFEDFFMADLNIEPMKIVGYEGVFGSIAMICILLPAVYFLPGKEGGGLHEDSIDTAIMIRHSVPLILILIVDMGALLCYNVSGMMVTGHLGAVFRTVLETMRTLFVWLVGLLLYYTPLGGGRLGESWSVYSYLQALGFVVLVSGTLVYSKGDEAGAKKELQEAVHDVLQQDSEAAALLPDVAGANATAAVPIVSRPTPIISSSLKATMNITAGSYSRSFSKSLPQYGRDAETTES